MRTFSTTKIITDDLIRAGQFWILDILIFTDIVQSKCISINMFLLIITYFKYNLKKYIENEENEIIMKSRI